MNCHIRWGSKSFEINDATTSALTFSLALQSSRCMGATWLSIIEKEAGYILFCHRLRILSPLNFWILSALGWKSEAAMHISRVVLPWRSKRVCQSQLRDSIRARKKDIRARKKRNYRDLKDTHNVERQQVVKAIESSKENCWIDLRKEVESDPWGRPYKVMMSRVKS